MRLRLSILTACALSAAAVTAGPAPAIVDGKLEKGNAHGYVGVVLGNLRCSGTLVAPDLVVTAGHCVVGRAPSQVVFSLENPAPGAPNPLPATGTIPGYVRAVQTATIPTFPQAPPPFANDVAVVRLEQPYPDARKFARLPKLGVVDRMLRDEGAKGTVVGYGLLGWANGTPVGAAPPWYRYSKRVDLLPGGGPRHVMIEPGAACQGDSGGPLLRGSRIVGVGSATELPDCTGRAVYYRLDTAEAQAFLASQGVPLHPGRGDGGEDED